MPAREMLIAAGLLAGFALASAALVGLTHDATEERIAANRRGAVLERLHSILPPSSYDNALAEDTIQVTAPERLGSEAPLTVYRARRDGAPVAVIMTVVAPDGYNGAIRLLVGIRADGTIAGVRVVRHQETPGLGDAIESSKSDWIEQFRGRAIGRPPASEWAVRKDGGAFDQLTGATITPRAVVEAVRNALIYFGNHREALFRDKAPPAGNDNPEAA